MRRAILKDVVEWDSYNWSRAIKNWKLEDLKGKKALGLGECGGGLSLLFALHGADVVCSDYQWMGSESQKKAVELHSRYHVQDKICYEDVDAMNIPYENEFDIIFLNLFWEELEGMDKMKRLRKRFLKFTKR